MEQQTFREEYSAGGVVYKKFTAGSGQWTVKWLLGKHGGYHKWVLPKGMIEAGETEKETALREVKEETGVEARIVEDQPIYIDQYEFKAEYKETISDKRQTISEKEPIRRVMKYQEAGGEGTLVKKTVTYYLMEWVEGNPEEHDWEMEDAGWYSFEEAIKLMSFEGEEMALQHASTSLSASAQGRL
jgi:8-oxo-dGTP pyrophosphatase MutT (NUDIX family)